MSCKRDQFSMLLWEMASREHFQANIFTGLYDDNNYIYLIFQEALAMAERYGLVYFETSALTSSGGVGISSCVDRLVKMVMQRVEDSVEKDYIPMKR